MNTIRLLALTIALCLCLSNASATNQTFFVPQNSNAYTTDTAVAVGDVLYTRYEGYWYRYTVDSASMTDIGMNDGARSPATGESVYYDVFSDDHRLYGLRPTTGELWLLTEGEDGLDAAYQTTLDMTPLTFDEDFILDPLSFAVAGDHLAIGYAEGFSDFVSNLSVWDMTTGATCYTLKEGASFVSPYDETHVLYAPAPQDDRFGETTITGTDIRLLDVATGESQTLYTEPAINVNAAFYLASENALLIIKDAKAYKQPLPAGEQTLCSYLPFYDARHMGLLGDSHLYLCDQYRGLYLRQLDPEAAERGVLTIMNPPLDEQHYAYLRQYPEVAVSCIDDGAYSDDDLIAAFQAGTLEADLISSYSLPLERLARKGYIAPINDPVILAVAERMDEALIAPCKVDGQLYALPITGFTNAYLYDCYNAEMLGFTEDTLPKTFPELIQLIAEWAERFGDEFSDYIPFWDNYLKRSLYRTVYENYCAYIAREGQPMHFDTPLFRKLMETIGSVDLDAVAHELGMDDDKVWEKSSLLNDMSSLEVIDSREPYAILPLALDEGIKPVIPVKLRVMMLNARSPRQKEAVDYLRCIAENYPYNKESVVFFPDRNDELIQPGWDELIEEVEAQIAEAQAQLESLDTLNTAELRDSIRSNMELLEDLKESRVTVTRESIIQFRERVAPCYYCPPNNQLMDELLEVLMRYADGAATMEQTISEMENRAQLELKEDE